MDRSKRNLLLLLLLVVVVVVVVLLQLLFFNFILLHCCFSLCGCDWINKKWSIEKRKIKRKDL